MTDEDAPQVPVQRHHPGALIHNRWRWAAGLVGMACLVTGAVAIFVTDAEAGPVALIAAGVIFTFIAMGGRMPNRLKIGDNEATFEVVADYLQDRLSDASEEDKADEISRIRDIAEVAPQVAGPALEQEAYEQYVRRALQGFVSQTPGLDVSRVEDMRPVDYKITDLESGNFAFAIVRAHITPEKSNSLLVGQILQLVQVAPVFVITRGEDAQAWGLTNRLGPRVLIVPLERGKTGAFKVAINLLSLGMFASQLPKEADVDDQ